METVEERLDRIENRYKLNFFDIERRLVELESVQGGTDSKHLEDKMHELEDLVLILQVDLTKIKDSLKGGFGFEMPDLSALEHRLDELEKRPGQPETVTQSPTEIAILNERLGMMEKEMESLKESQSSEPVSQPSVFGKSMPDNINERLESIEKDIEGLKGSQSMLSSYTSQETPADTDNDVNERLNEMEQTVESLKMLEEALVRLESKMDDIAMFKPPTDFDITKTEARIRAEFEEKMKEIESKIKEPEMPADIERRLEYVENETKDLVDIKKAVEEETNSRINLEKKLQETSYAPKAPKVDIDVEKLRNEIESQRNIIEDINKHIEIKSTKFLTRELEEFAKVLDKKLQGMEAPKVDARLRSIEQKLEKLAGMIRDINSTMPVIIE